MKNLFVSLLLSSFVIFSANNSAIAEESTKTKKELKKEMKMEMKKHPRILKAIKELQDVLEYLEKAPDDFGGNKAKAIASSKQAIQDLKKALEFKAKQK